MYRSIYVTTVTSLIALSAQSAIAATVNPEPAQLTVPAAAQTIGVTENRTAATPAGSLERSFRVRAAARIPGTFAINSAEASSADNARNDQLTLRVLMPALAGDGGG